MNDITLKLVYSADNMEEIKEMQEVDSLVSNVLNTNINSIDGFNMLWLVKSGDKTIGYTELKIEKETLKYYMNVSLKAGYRTSDIVVKVLKNIKKQELACATYFESKITRPFINDTKDNLSLDEQINGKSIVYKMNK